MKSIVDQGKTKLLKPGTWGLLQAIKGLMQATNMLGMSRINKARRLQHENFFIKMAIEKCVFNI